MVYYFVSSDQLRKHFQVIEINHSLTSLGLYHCPKPIIISNPFYLDERVATLVGLLPDGCVVKDLMRIDFAQKKDLTKVDLFEDSLISIFSSVCNPLRRLDKSDGTLHSYTNSKVLAHFIHYVLDVSKSDQPTKIPSWIFNSPRNVRLSYLQQAWDMEGTILKKLREIRFAVRDKGFATDMQKLLLTFEIDSHLTFAPRPYMSSDQYRISIYRKENFERFKEIGFRIPFLKYRFQQLCNKYKINSG